MSVGPLLGPLLGAVAIGMAFAAQPAINAAAARVLASPVAAAAVSISITLSISLAALLALRAAPAPGALTALPWWVALGGLIGFLVVAGGVAIVPLTGAALFFVCLVAGQLVGAAIIDHIGAFGLPVREISPMRLAGIGLALAGVVLVHLSAGR
ncbi:MAG: DMT family transporter [Pseudomonadota bacterium]